ncbi:hypothetical protein IY804_04070, partial [Campylobacter volucris]|uniref:hypothetical protein n=1 Tax=Campylobacter volucris TaxID=1031542 RepID=UPI0018A0195C
MTLVTTSAIAGNFDILAMEEFYNIVNSWLKDTHIVIIPSVILFCIGIWRAIAGSFIQTLLMCGFGVVTMQGL